MATDDERQPPTNEDRRNSLGNSNLSTVSPVEVTDYRTFTSLLDLRNAYHYYINQPDLRWTPVSPSVERLFYQNPAAILSNLSSSSSMPSLVQMQKDQATQTEPQHSDVKCSEACCQIL